MEAGKTDEDQIVLERDEVRLDHLTAAILVAG